MHICCHITQSLSQKIEFKVSSLSFILNTINYSLVMSTDSNQNLEKHSPKYLVYDLGLEGERF